VTVLAVSIGGLAVVMHQENRAATMDIGRSEGQIRALELAETGLARAATEVSSLVDSDGNGIGNVGGNYAGGSYAVTATQNGADWTLVSTGRIEKVLRRIEQRVRRNTTTAFGAAILAAGDISVSGGGTQTDSFDSRLGSYASQ